MVTIQNEGLRVVFNHDLLYGVIRQYGKGTLQAVVERCNCYLIEKTLPMREKDGTRMGIFAPSPVVIVTAAQVQNRSLEVAALCLDPEAGSGLMDLVFQDCSPELPSKDFLDRFNFIYATDHVRQYNLGKKAALERKVDVRSAFEMSMYASFLQYHANLPWEDCVKLAEKRFMPKTS